jgi:hypothetical protein
MIFTCPHCQKQHRLPDEVTLPPNAAAHCKKCGRRFSLNNEPPSSLMPDRESGSEPGAEKPAAGSGNESSAVVLDTFPELRGLSADKFLLDEIFTSDHGKAYQDATNRLLTRVLVATAPLLSENLLQKTEQVKRIASGIAYFPFEIPYANGLLTWPLNYYALVATNRRLIFINLDYHLSHPTRYVFQVRYDNISRISTGFYGTSLIVATPDGRRWDFTTINRCLATDLAKFIRGRMAQPEDDGLGDQPSSQFCPSCYRTVPEDLTSCPHCLVSYKSAAIAIRKSLLLPGTGNFYLANQNLGIVEILGYLLTWLMTIILVIIGIPGGIFSGGLLVLAYHCLSAFMAGQMAGKGYLPVDHDQRIKH